MCTYMFFNGAFLSFPIKLKRYHLKQYVSLVLGKVVTFVWLASLGYVRGVISFDRSVLKMYIARNTWGKLASEDLCECVHEHVKVPPDNEYPRLMV